MPTLADILGSKPTGGLFGIGLVPPPTQAELMVKMEQELYCEVGKFICKFAIVEYAVHRIFQRISGLKGDRARTLVAGKDISEMLRISKGMAALAPKSKFSQANRKELEILFQQISTIATFRNSLIHGGADIEAQGVIRTINFNKARSHDKIQEFAFGLPDIRNATYDLSSIILRLLHMAKADPWTRNSVRQLRRSPWLFKSLPPGNYWTRNLAEALKRTSKKIST